MFATHSSRARWAAFRSDSFFSSAHRAPLIGSLTPLRACRTPGLGPDLVERVGGTGDDVEAVEDAFGLRALAEHAPVDLSRPVAGDHPDGGAPSVRTGRRPSPRARRASG